MISWWSSSSWETAGSKPWSSVYRGDVVREALNPGSTPVDRQPLLGRSAVHLPDTDADLREVLQEDIHHAVDVDDREPARRHAVEAQGGLPGRFPAHLDNDLDGLPGAARSVPAGSG
jgi:hypothetical protein